MSDWNKVHVKLAIIVIIIWIWTLFSIKQSFTKLDSFSLIHWRLILGAQSGKTYMRNHHWIANIQSINLCYLFLEISWQSITSWKLKTFSCTCLNFHVITQETHLYSPHNNMYRYAFLLSSSSSVLFLFFTTLSFYDRNSQRKIWTYPINEQKRQNTSTL